MTTRFLIAAITMLLLSPFSTVQADIEVTIGATPIPRGDATGAQDITISNGIFAVAFAVDTAPPWGVARGGIIDIALLNGDSLGYDIASLADFMPNKWSSWPSSYQHVTIASESLDCVVVRTVRDWGEVELTTTFTIKDADSRVRIETQMTNKGEVALQDIHSGYVVWPDGGSLFGMPGLPSLVESNEDAAFANWSASYGEHWVLGLHTPFSEYFSYGGRDRYQQHNLAVGESRSFEAWLQIEGDGTLAPLVDAEIEFQQLQSGRISGLVKSDDGELVDRPAVVVMKDALPFTWALGSAGRYEVNLPVGNYEVYATAAGYAEGQVQKVLVTNGSVTEINFDDVRPPGAINFQVHDELSGKPLDARISIQSGQQPLISYFGKNRFFTELDSQGEITLDIAPGDYVFEIASGAGFTSALRLVETTVESGLTSKVDTSITVLATPHKRGWYSADLHHHSDVLDGFTEAEFVMRSELASGVDITFLSDHDSVVNNSKMQSLSDARGRHFIAGTELSPSWAHFNAFPLRDGAEVEIDTGRATAEEIFAAAREMGADIVEVNHPYSRYGYFQNDELGAIPGGFRHGFDLIEIQPGQRESNEKTLQRVWQLWNDGHRVYLAAGSDAHDVWLQDSGSARTYAYVDENLSIAKFVAALKAGHSFASQGPLVYPELLFGDDKQHSIGDELSLRYSVEAVSGLRSIILIEQGREIAERKFDAEQGLVDVEFVRTPQGNTWYSLVVEDMAGNFAYSNPLWVSAKE